MARNLTSNATVTISMNGRQANETMKSLQKEADRLQKQFDKAKAAGDKVAMDKAQRSLRQVNSQLQMLRTNTTAVEEVMRKLDRATPSELNKTLATLRRQLNGMERGSEMWDKQIAKIKLVEAELRKVNAAFRTQESGWNRMNRWLNDTQTFIMGAAAAVTGLVMAGRKAVNVYAEMDQEMANVRKFTGMTGDEVTRLNEEFKKMDTRSSREALNGLAQEAGRLGKQSLEDVLGFVRASDKINVSLDDLGEGATLTLSKLTGIFGEEKRLGTEKALLSVGSVINELSQNCSASAPYIAQFTSRMGGVASQAGMTVQQVMALAAVLDTTNQGVEAASTAVSQVITRLFQDPAKYARVAGLEVSNFSKLLRKDANEAFLTLLETLQKAGGMETLAPMFKDMGENGARAIAALSSLATHIKEVREQQEVANRAFSEAKSIDQEFQVQNTTELAKMEKARKNLNEIAVSLGEKLSPMMKYVYSSSSILLRVLKTLVSFISDNGKAIISLTAAIAAYTVAAKASVIWTKTLSAAQVLATGTSNKLKLALNAIKANPVGAIVAVLTALVTWLGSAAAKTDEFNKSMDEAMKSASSFSEEARKETREIDKLFGALEGAKKGTREYDDAKKAIISRYGIYLKGLINERGEITNLALAYDRLTFAARKSAQARGINAAKEKIDNTFFQEVDDLTEKLRESLESMGMDDRSSSRLVTSISQSVSSGNDVSESDRNEIARYFYQNRGFWESVKDLFSGESPMDILDSIGEIQTDYRKRSAKLEKMDNRYFSGMQDEELNQMIESLSGQLGNSPATEFDVSFSVKDKDKDIADKIAESISRGVEKKADSSMILRQSKPVTTLPTGSLPASLPITQTPVNKKPEPVLISDAGKASGILNRTQAENFLRELLYEKSQRPASIDTNNIGNDGDFNPYLSDNGSENADRKAAAEARREAAKAKKEFRDGLAAIKAEYLKKDEEIVMSYAKGESDYLSYLKGRNDAEQDYYDKSRKFYENQFSTIKDSYIEDDKDYQALLKSKTDALKKYQDTHNSYESSRIRKKASFDEQVVADDAKLQESRTIDDEIRLQNHIMKIRTDAIRMQMDLYAKGTKEWENLKLQLEQATEESRLSNERLYLQKVNALRREYNELSGIERYKIEVATLRQLYIADLIKIEEYEKLKAQLRQKYSKDLPGGDFRRTPSEEKERREKERQKQFDQIDAAVESGMISEEEGDRRKNDIDAEALDALIEKVKGCGNEWVSMVAAVADAWKNLWRTVGEGGDILQNIGDVANASFAVVTAGMQMASQFAQANAQIEQKKIEKRYEREAELAQGNSYLVAKLEKQKEDEIAEVKNKASRQAFQMQVIQAIAQTIQGGINAYTSTAAIPVVGPALAPAAAAVAVAAGMVNVALLKKQQEAAESQGYAEGGYTRPGRKYDVAGVVHAGEWVASQELLASPVASPIIQMLDKAQRENRIGSLRAADSSRVVLSTRSGLSPGNDSRASAAPVIMQGSDPGSTKTLKDLADVVRRLSRRLDEPFVTVNTVTGPNGINNAQDEYKRLINNKKKVR